MFAKKINSFHEGIPLNHKLLWDKIKPAIALKVMSMGLLFLSRYVLSHPDRKCSKCRVSDFVEIKINFLTRTHKRQIILSFISKPLKSPAIDIERFILVLVKNFVI